MAMVPYAPGIDAFGTGAQDMILGGQREWMQSVRVALPKGWHGPEPLYALIQCCIRHADPGC